MATMSMGDLKATIDRKSVVSFDIFDTLIARNVASPRDVFRLMETRVREISGSLLFDFDALRSNAEKEALESSKEHGVHEVTLDQIYNQMLIMTGASPAVIDEIKRLEIETEISCMCPRVIGKSLFKYALSIGKTVVLASDMYLPRHAIERLLLACGIDGYDKFYLSSDVMMTKREGDLFDHILADLGVRASDVVHLGDNPIGDYKSPMSRGIDAVVLDRAVAYMRAANDKLKAIQSVTQHDNDLGYSVISSLIANKYFDEKDANYSQSIFRGNAYQMGYMALGPMMAAFCSWLHREAKRDGIERLFFLSRDGWIMKRVYEELFRGHSPIEAVYLLSSRRSTRVPLMLRPTDYYEPLKKPIYATEVGHWLTVNYGLDGYNLPVQIFDKVGLPGPEFGIGAKADRSVLRALVRELMPHIEDAARSEREAYRDYLAQFDFGRPGDAIVDIGYAGTMQNSLSILTGKKVPGYYFAVFGTAHKSGAAVEQMYGYAVKGGADSNPAFGICTHRFLYESLTCSAEDSFVRMRRVDGELVADRLASFDDDRRKAVIADAHAGCIKLAEDFCAAGVVSPDQIHVSPTTATAILDSYFRSPLKDDVPILGGVEFSDLYGPRQPRYLTADVDLGREVNPSNLIWKEALSFFSVNPKGHLTGSKRQDDVSSLESVAIAKKVTRPNRDDAGSEAILSPQAIAANKATHAQLKQIVEVASLRFSEGRFIQAGELFAKAFEIRPQPQYARAAGECYGLGGSFEASATLLEAAKSLIPENKRLNSRLEKARAKVLFSADDPDYFSLANVTKAI